MSVTTLQSESFSFNRPMDQAARILVFLTLFFLVTLHISDTILLVALVLFYAQSNFKQKIQFALAFRMNILLLCFLALLFISLFYSVGPWHDRLATFWKYFDKLFFFFFLIPLFLEKRWRNTALIIFVVSTFLNLILWTLSVQPISFMQPLMHHAPIPHILHIFATQSFSSTVAIVSYGLLWKCCETPFKKINILYGVLFLICLYFTFFVNIERVGMMTEIVLMALFLWQHCRRYRWLSLALLTLVCIGIYFLSPTVKQRIAVGYDNIQALSYTHNTSLGIRIENTKDSLILIRERPWFGWGAGSYATLTQQYFPQDYELFGKQKAPENGFLYIGVETGCIGLALVFAWLLLQWLEARKYLPRFEAGLTYALIIGFVLLSVTASQFDSHFEMVKQVLLVSIVFGAAFRRDKTAIEGVAGNVSTPAQ